MGFAGGRVELVMRRLDQVIASRALFDAARIEAEIAAAAVEVDSLFRGQVDFIFGTGDVQAKTGD
ncbi:hypothetical protein D3C81_1803620 [compost metagenome]